MTSNQVGNPHTLKQDLFPCMYFCKSTSNGIYYNGYKGCSSFAFVGPGGFSNGHSFTLDSVKDKILVNGFVLPWSGNGSYLLA
jgi:hypothetical protein